MAWIEMINEDEAEGKLKKLYKQISSPETGQVANVLKVHSLNPEVLKRHFRLYKSIMFGESNLPRYHREMIATVVSRINGCHYWIVHHGAALQQLWDGEDAEEVVENIKKDYEKTPISEKEKESLKYAEKLTRNPSSLEENDLQALRDKGYSDRDILDINQVVSYFNYVNRVADGLGIELE